MLPKEITLRRSLKVAERVAIDLANHHLTALMLGMYKDEPHRQRLLTGLGMATFVRDQLEFYTPALDYVRKQCRPQKHPLAAYRRMLDGLKDAGASIPALLREFFQNLPAYNLPECRPHPEATAAAEKLTTLPDVLDQAKALAESHGDMDQINVLLN